MKYAMLGVLSLAALLAAAPIAQAEDVAPPASGAPAIAPAPGDAMMMGPGPGGHGKFKNMTPEERAAHRAKMKEKFDSLPPEKQAEIKARMEERKKAIAEAREKMKNMTPEQKEAFKKEWLKEHSWKKPGHEKLENVPAGEPVMVPPTTR